MDKPYLIAHTIKVPTTFESASAFLNQDSFTFSFYDSDLTGSSSAEVWYYIFTLANGETWLGATGAIKEYIINFNKCFKLKLDKIGDQEVVHLYPANPFVSHSTVFKIPKSHIYNVIKVNGSAAETLYRILSK